MSLIPSAAKRGLIAAALLGGTLFAAAPAQAFNVNTLTSYNTEAEDLNYIAATDNDPATVATYPDCPKVNIIVARGTDEQQGQSPATDGWTWNGWTYITGPKSSMGVWHRVARELYDPPAGLPNIADASNDVLRTDVTYAASLNFGQSVPSGTVRLMNYMTKITNRCNQPGRQTKFALIGFSQGALVIGNALSSWNERIFWANGSQEISADVHNRILGVGLVADPGFNSTPGIVDQAGNFDPAFWGVTPRPSNSYPWNQAIGGAPPFAGQKNLAGLTAQPQHKIRNYCVARDWACQNSNPNNDFQNVHAQTSWHVHSKQSLAEWLLLKLRADTSLHI